MAADPALPPPRPAGSFRSVVDMWNHRVSSTPESPAMLHRRGGSWVPLTWRDADARVRALAGGLLAWGLGPEDRCAILATTSVPWVLADMAIVGAGGATTTIYPSEPAEEVAWIAGHAGARVVFCDTDAQVDKLLAHRDALPALEHVVVFDGAAREDGFVTTLAALEEAGEAWNTEHPDGLADRQATIAPEHLATLIYTSGTTGRPKGVELTHDAWVYEAEAIDRLGVLGPDDVQLLFLPLAHVFAKVMQVTFIRLGITTAVDGNTDRFLQNLGEVRPTWMAAVPRVFEKAYNRIVAEARDQGMAVYTTFKWAVQVGRQVSRLRRNGASVPPWLLAQEAVADRLVFRRIRARFGGRLRFSVSGGAPLPLDIARFFDACGVLLCEGYGLTESAAASCVNSPDHVIFGSVGRPLPGCEVRIDDDGEILLRSRGVMRGYHDDPEATSASLTDDGWLRTGDIGRILPSGHVQITDRKKDLIVTAGGKNVAPAHVQNLLKSRSPHVAHVLVHGDRRNFCSALVDVDEDAVRRWARGEGLDVPDRATMTRHPEVLALLQLAIDDVNRELPGYEQIRRWAITPAPFTIENGLLTPSLKMKRRAIERRYADVLDGFYEGAVAAL